MIDLTVKIDNEEAKKKLKELQRFAKQTTSSIVTDAERMDTAFRAIGKGDNEPLNNVKRKAKKTADEVVIATKQAETEIKREAEATTEKINQEQEKRKRKAKKTADEIQKAYTTTINIPAFTVKTDIPKTNPLEGIDTALTHIPDKANKAAGSIGSLNFATQQLVREVPAATMGLHMFFLAISNNLPFFADAIKQVREENKALAASGKPTVSVFKQIIGSLFSWQTALIAGITALTLYGKEIGNWVKGLFKGKEAIDAIAQAEQTLADVRRQGMLDAQEEATQVKLSVKAMQDSNLSLDERKRAMRTLQEQYPEHFGKLKEEKLLYGEIGESVDALIERMVALATARTSFDKLVENTQNLQLLQGMDSYTKFESANAAYEARGRKKREMQLSGGQYRLGITNQYWAWDKAQDALLKDLKNGGEEAEALFKEISDKYDGDVDAYIKATEESNKKLSEKASGIITKPDLSEDKAAAEEQKRKAEAVLAEAEREAEERKRILAQLNNDLSKEVQRTQREMDDAEIATIKDGIERKRREIQKGYERRAAEIDKLEADIKKAQGGTLTPEQKGHISYLRQANTDTLNAGKVLVKSMQDEVAQEATDAMNEYLASYGTFQEKILAITAKYQRLIANAQTEGERKTLEAERDAILAEYEVQASDWAKELVDKTTEQLNTMISELQAQVDAKQAAFNALDSSDSQQAKDYQKEINTLKAKIKELQEQLNKANKAVKDDNWADATQVFQNISKAAQDAAEGIEEFDEGLATALRGIANLSNTAINMIGAIKGVMTAFAEGLKGIEKASAILAVVGAAIQAVSVLIGLFKGSDEVEQTMRQFKELNTELERFRKLAQIDSVEGTIFGKDAFGNFRNNLKVLEDAVSELNESREALIKKRYDDLLAQYKKELPYREVDGGIVFDNPNDLFAKQEEVERYNALKAKQRSLETALANIVVKTRDRSGFAEFFGAQDEYGNLGDLYPELFAGGEVSLEGLRKLKESDLWEKISQENRDLIDELIADWEYYEEATAAVTDYLKDVFGDYGATITDVLVDSFKDGTDAVEAFGDAASNVIERLTKDFIYSTFIKDFIDQADADIAELNNNKELSSEERVKGLIDILKELESNVQGQQDEINAALAEMEAAGYGYDGEASGRSTTHSKGFQAMSQETGSELNGRFTDIQGQTHRIAEAVEFCKSLHLDNLSQVTSINTTVAAIHNDTTLIERHTRVLRDMDNKLERIVRNTEGL